MQKATRKRLLKETLFFGFLACTLAVTMLPFIFMSAEALAPSPLVQTQGSRYLPQNWSLDSFRQLLSVGDVGRFAMNSMIHAFGYTFLSLLLNSLAAFAFARMVFPGRDRLFTMLILAMMIPGQVIMIPVFVIVKSLGMLNSFAGLIIPGCAHAFGIFAVRQFMLDLPDEIFDAARTDGCSDFDLFVHIALPLCRPILASLAVTSFIYTWDQFLYPLVIMQDEPMFTLPVALVSLTSQHFGSWGMLLAGGVVTALPSLIVFMVAQRAYVAGITSGSSKG
ncbi:MAG: sugar ABC transporter permease [Candidatus Riflebacteria bacterium HGW-Riflebacteria-1]|jgi:multiple sugar transport system permease protein|nr:MAG: sugar ABC transporter permease [Candidatus Riflebacteria bacterium HGW-Riflebacteria-1]